MTLSVSNPHFCCSAATTHLRQISLAFLPCKASPEGSLRLSYSHSLQTYRRLQPEKLPGIEKNDPDGHGADKATLPGVEWSWQNHAPPRNGFERRDILLHLEAGVTGQTLHRGPLGAVNVVSNPCQWLYYYTTLNPLLNSRLAWPR